MVGRNPVATRERIVTVRVPESRGAKSDERDAFGLADQLRTGAIEMGVYKQVGPFGTLRQLVKAHQMIVRDSVRVQSRIKAVFRSRGVSVVGKAVYSPGKRDEYLRQLPASSRAAALLLFEQYDALRPVRDHAEKQLVAESHKHAVTKPLETCPGLGEIRVAQLVSVVVAPERFRTRAQFWSYCGLGIVMRSSSDWTQTSQGRWVRAPVQQTRGLNRNHNRLLKLVFKGAATSVIQQGPSVVTYRWVRDSLGLCGDGLIGERAYDELHAGLDILRGLGKPTPCESARGDASRCASASPCVTAFAVGGPGHIE